MVIYGKARSSLRQLSAMGVIGIYYCVRLQCIHTNSVQNLHLYGCSSCWNVALCSHGDIASPKTTFFRSHTVKMSDWLYNMYTVISRHNSADSVPTSNLVCMKEVAIRTTFSHMFNISGLIYYNCSVVIDIQITRYKTLLTNCVSNNFLRSIRNKF